MSNGNEPAFPTSVQRGQSGEYWTEDEGGLTKREYFAAMAMQGLIANGELRESCAQTAAMIAVKSADALLAELAK